MLGITFFDFESMMFRGREPSMRVQELKQWYTRDSKTSAKHIDSTSTNLPQTDDSENTDNVVAHVDGEKELLPKTKKDKLTFRNRKVLYS